MLPKAQTAGVTLIEVEIPDLARLVGLTTIVFPTTMVPAPRLLAVQGADRGPPLRHMSEQSEAFQQSRFNSEFQRPR
jgi:hypothetical protein